MGFVFSMWLIFPSEIKVGEYNRKKYLHKNILLLLLFYAIIPEHHKNKI